jgi:hypothetical protein
MKITFFNHYHNGDIHLSRGIIRKIINKVHEYDSSVKFSYSHPNKSNLLFDISELDYDFLSLSKLDSQNSIIKLDDTIYINTWYDQQNQKYSKKYGILTIDALYGALSDSCEQIWDFKLDDTSSDLKDFFPIIDYSKFDIEIVQFWLHNHKNKKILIENGHSFSGQSHNFDMTSVAIKLANQHPDIIFILSKKEDLILPNNIFYSSDIIKKTEGSDLNEISFLSTHCDMIIGRSSGVFSFTMVNENLFKRKIKLISFAHLIAGQTKFWLGPKFSDQIYYSSNIIVSNAINTNRVLDIINENL